MLVKKAQNTSVKLSKLSSKSETNKLQLVIQKQNKLTTRRVFLLTEFKSPMESEMSARMTRYDDHKNLDRADKSSFIFFWLLKNNHVTHLQLDQLKHPLMTAWLNPERGSEY